MPSRSSRNNNARKHPSTPHSTNANNNELEPRQPQPLAQPRRSSPLPFSPPTQLPTPLPEESQIPPTAPGTLDLLNFPPDGGRDDSNTTLSRLIDFDTSTPPHQPLLTRQSETTYDMGTSLLSSEGERDGDVYRSPPYREARLPEEQEQSPPPLPILPRYQRQYVDDGNGSAQGEREATFVSSPPPTIVAPAPSNAHVRYPSNPTSPTSSSTFDSLSRTIRGYVPSPAPSAAPRVSRPVVSHAMFSGSQAMGYTPTDSRGHTRAQSYSHPHPERVHQEFERDYERDDGDAYGYGKYGGYPASPPPPHPATLPPPHGYRQEQYSTAQRQPNAPRQAATTTMRAVGSGLAQAIRRGAAAGAGVVNARGVGGSGQARKPVDGTRKVEEKVLWARWDVLNERRVLLVAYPAGLQMWDCADLSAIREVFNLDLSAEEWALVLGGGSDGGGAGAGQKARVAHAAVLPWREGGEKDMMAEARPLLGILLESADEDEREQEPRSVFVVYSLRTHHVTKMRPMPGLASTFTANENFIVIGTTIPPTLHVLSSTTFHTLHIITSAHLEPYSTPSASHTTSIPTAISISNAISNTAQSTSVSLGLSIDTNTNTSKTNINASGKSSPESAPAPPHPVFALSHRLLAYASPTKLYSPPLLATTSSSSSMAARRLSSSSAGSIPPSGTPSSLSPSPFAGGIGKITGITQADVGHAALKVGESVFSGMKFLGGMALEAAKNRVGSSAGAVGPEGRVGAFGSGSPNSGGRAGYVSRSAPDDNTNISTWDRDRDSRGASLSSAGSPSSPSPHLTTVAPSTRPTSEHGHYVTVVDLGLLLRGTKGATPTKIDEFNVSRSQAVAGLSFAGDGTSVAAVLRDGHAVRVFKLQPAPRVLLEARAAAISAASPSLGNVDDLELRSEVGRHAAHLYDLYRGRTSAVVEGVEWAADGRWVALGTRNRTVHVFGVNPYGGKPDVKSHMEGRVRNVDTVESRLVKIHPLVRLRGAKSSTEHALLAPLAFTFLSPAEVASSPTLAFPFAPRPVTNSPTFSAPKLTRATNFQDLLVFDPVDCVLSLRRLTIDKHAVKDQGLSAALGVTSISLPGAGGAGRLSSSPASRPADSTTKVKADGEAEIELVVREGVEATWNLKRGKNWVELKTNVVPKVGVMKRHGLGADWLAEGEISTCSKSTRVLPRSLYLSHQFSFHTLGEDYHALIRRYRFDISGNKIEVRKVVEISAYTSAGGESSFVEGFSSPRDIRRASSSFDEPIASAISGSFDNSNLPTILPMYPNGVPGSKPKSFRSSIPIRTMAGLGDGVSEGIGRIRREMHKAAVRSPQLVPRPDSSLSGPVPLEFDEEDEDFLTRDTLDVPIHVDTSTSRGTSRDAESTASTNLSLATPLDTSTHQLLDADVVGAMEEDLWDGWDHQDKQAVEEAEQFHDLTDLAGVEEEQPRQLPPVIPSKQGKSSKREGRAKRRG